MPWMDVSRMALPLGLANPKTKKQIGALQFSYPCRFAARGLGPCSSPIGIASPLAAVRIPVFVHAPAALAILALSGLRLFTEWLEWAS